MTPWDIGWFVVAINLSDIAAKGGKPEGILLSCGLPRDYELAELTDLLEGAKTCIQQFDTKLLGGDTKENKVLTISGTAFGTISPDEIMYRKGARIGDIVAVTGSLGKAAAGFYGLQQKKTEQEMLAGLIHPFPRISAGRILASTKKIHCCMDLSDGLSSSLYQLSEINNVGFEIENQLIPASSLLSDLQKKKVNINFSDALFHFGGDYELLFTTAVEDFPSIKQQLSSIALPVTNIGTVTESLDIKLKTDSSQNTLPNKGYEHFSHRLF
jgi:thiamine-monophosphate kinase